MSNNTFLKVEAIVKASVEKTWQSWTNPKHIVNWNFASDDWHCPNASNDLSAGGKLCWTMAAKDGSMSFDFEGTYDKVTAQKELLYTLDDGRKVNVLFEQVENDTKVIELFEPEGTNPHEMQKAGWQAILNNFKKYVESPQ